MLLVYRKSSLPFQKNLEIFREPKVCDLLKKSKRIFEDLIENYFDNVRITQEIAELAFLK